MYGYTIKFKPIVYKAIKKMEEIHPLFWETEADCSKELFAWSSEVRGSLHHLSLPDRTKKLEELIKLFVDKEVTIKELGEVMYLANIFGSIRGRFYDNSYRQYNVVEMLENINGD